MLPDSLQNVLEEPCAPSRVRAIVLDDDPISRSLQARLLALLGHEALTPVHPDEALRLALADAADLMLLDIGMPGRDGFDVLRALREREAAFGRAPLPVIAVTGYASAQDRLRCLMAGFFEHLSKPVQAATLGAAIERCVPLRARAGAASDAQRLAATAHRLRRVRPDDAAFAPTVLETFALNCTQLLEAMQRAVAREAAAELAHAAVGLRASAEFMGASGLAGLADTVHRAAAEGRIEKAATAIPAVTDELHAVLAVLLPPSQQAPRR